MINALVPKTILYVHSSDEMYGADLILLQLVVRLSQRGFRPVVVVPTDVPYTGELSKALNEHKIRTIRLKTAIMRRKHFTPSGIFVYFWRLCISTLSLIWVIHRESADIVHSNTAAVLPGALAAFITRRPHVWHIHEIIVKPRFLWRLTSWLLPRFSKKIIAVSDSTRDHLCVGNWKNGEKTDVIHNGIDISRFKDIKGSGRMVRNEWDIRPNEIIIGMVGRISHWKGQEYFLKAASRLTNDYTDVKLVMVGGTFPGQEYLADNLRKLVSKLGLTKSVIISEFRSDIPAILDAFDIFVLPSTSPDPFPTVILEAMAAQKPVIANAHGGSIEMVDPQITGILVSPECPDEMYAAMKQLIDDPMERILMGKRGHKRLLEKFSLESFIEKWLKLYGSLIPKI
jgi:glycosyltransferase involved in cell wall biosynthesis